jgi:hypothetical protein
MRRTLAIRAPSPSMSPHHDVHPDAPQNGGPTQPAKDLSHESELVIWEPPDIEQEPLAEKIRVDAEFYKRVGFYAALGKTAEEEFRRSIQRLNQVIKTKINNLQKELTEDIKRFSVRKQDADQKIVEIKDALSRYQKEIENLKEELPALTNRYEELREEIKKVFINIGSKKETLIKDRQQALLEELNSLNSQLESVVTRRMNLNEEIFIKQKDALEKKKQFWLKLFDQYDGEHKEVLTKLKLFSVPGFHLVSSNFLYNAGLIAATVAGAFFASFAEVNYFASGGMLSFIIQALFGFSTGFMNESTGAVSFAAKLSRAGILLGLFLGLFALMFAVSWLCQFLYQKLIQGRDQEKKLEQNAADPDPLMNAFLIEINREELPVRTKISEKTFFGLWMRGIPFLLFLTIGFVLVSLGTDATNLKSLDAAMAGYGIGVLIALACAGVAYVYLTMFLERRIEQRLDRRTDGHATPISWTKMNLELLAIILIFIVVAMVTLLVFQHPFTLASSTASTASFMFFVGSCLLTAFILGFGIRLRGLDDSRRELEDACDIIQTRLIRISRPFQIYLTRVENAHFNRKFIQIRDEIMNLMLARTVLTRRAIDTPLINTARQTGLLSVLRNWVRNISEAKAKEPPLHKSPTESADAADEHTALTASEAIRLCFPQLGAELSALEAESSEVKARIDGINNEITFRSQQKGDYYEKKIGELKDQEIRSRNYHKAIANREKKSHYEVAAEQRREKFFTQKIVEGYELGCWFTKHGGPAQVVPDFTWSTNGEQ